MKQVIEENKTEAYRSLIFNIGSDVYWLNIADCTNRGNAPWYRRMELLHDMIDVFWPVILHFIEDNSLDKNVGLVILDGDGTSVSGAYICRNTTVH